MSNVEGLDGLNRRLKAITKAQSGIGREWGLKTVAYAKDEVAVKTGTTRRTIRLASASGDSATVTAGGAAPFLEYDTRPHIIRPRKARVLRFPAAGVKTTLSGRVRAGEVKRLGSGAYAFARQVLHPGTKAQPFLLKSGKRALEELGVKPIIDAWNKAD